MAACEGLEWVEQKNGSPRMDALDICNAVAAALQCEVGDSAWMAMLKQGWREIRALSPAQAIEAPEGGETRSGSTEGESAVGPQADAPSTGAPNANP